MGMSFEIMVLLRENYDIERREVSAAAIIAA
jgi:hypothetical protein